MSQQDALTAVLESRLAEAVNVVEAKLDAEIDKLSHMDEDDLGSIACTSSWTNEEAAASKTRMAFSRPWKIWGDWRRKGIFEEGQRSTNLVCHFFRSSTFRCKIVDKHLSLLAPQHLECRFIKLDVERAPFLTQRLNIRVLPTICIVKDGNTKDYIVGFDQLGGHDEFTTEMLEWANCTSGYFKYVVTPFWCKSCFFSVAYCITTVIWRSLPKTKPASLAQALFWVQCQSQRIFARVISMWILMMNLTTCDCNVWHYGRLLLHFIFS